MKDFGQDGLQVHGAHEPEVDAVLLQRGSSEWTEVKTYDHALDPRLNGIDCIHGGTLPWAMARLDRLQYLISLGYDGSRFYGIPNQPGYPTVSVVLRARLEAAAGQRARALNFTARTDRGVHAEENLATCWFLPPFDALGFERSVAVDRPDGLLNVVASPTDFHTHARNISQGKWYRYRLRTDRVDDSRAWSVAPPSDLQSMYRLAEAMVGRHDFSAYSYKCASPNRVKRIDRVELSHDTTGITVDIEGDGFLRHMVRKMVATLVAVGAAEFDLQEALNLLHSGAPRGTPRSAPAHGLTLMAIRRQRQ